MPVTPPARAAGVAEVSPGTTVPPADTACAALGRRLPKALTGGLRGRPTVPDSPRTAAWGDPPVVLRCGVPRPRSFGVGADLTEIDGVSWLMQIGPDVVVWTVVDRPVYLEVVVPRSYDGQGPLLVDIARAVAATFPHIEPEPAR